MKSSLLCLINALDFESHNFYEMVKAYQRFGAEISHHFLHLIVCRGLTIALHEGGLPSVKQLWVELQVGNLLPIETNKCRKHYFIV